ncbi:lysosomal acid phosphatase-like isoform X2 [Belonocnema kinseyi]|uniref:lysosomal acid phosphatase-like isoform X2 n=1 Tax=Belonocnema kinseyi TaxID=2817044 RepID=UPI00143D0604|nr:lysosomal acid phosphatase-like isoform X2 [Belonocnema kinseyi]
MFPFVVFFVVVGIGIIESSAANSNYHTDDLGTIIFANILGRHQHLLLGRWLRNRYSKILPETYTYYDIYVRSTDVDRTLMSAESNLAGLYPPKGSQIWDSIKWMPIPVHTITQTQDNLLAMKKYCPRYEYELENLKNSPEMKRIDQDNAKLYSYLTQHSGKKINSLEEIEFLYNSLYIEELYNKPLPEWTKYVYPEKMKPLAEKSFAIPCYNKILRRLKAGLLVGEMVQHLVEKSRNSLKPDRKLWIYSAHDETVANFLMALGLFDLHCPPYAATVLMELRLNSQKEHIVTISYKNSSDEPTLLTLPGCILACPLSQFVRLTKSLIPENWEQECRLRFESNEYMNSTGIIEILTASVLMLILILMLIIGLVYWHHKREHAQYYLRLTTEPM